MKQTIRHILPLLFLLPLFCACQEDSLCVPETEGAYLSLSLATQANTRATEQGEDAFNENRIERADVYFFPENKPTATCIYARLGLRPTPVSGSGTDYTLQVPLDKSIILEGTTYYVYVVANHAFDGLTEETALSETLGSLQEKTITTEWKPGYQADGTAETNEDYVIESSLVMDGGKDIPISVQQPETPETIAMTRAMAKVTLSASMEKTIESNGLTYTPMPSRMFTTLVYAVQRTNLAGDYTVNATRDYITRMRRNYNETPVNGEQRERYSQVAPFYSYPNPENTTDRRDSYLILCVPWMARADGGPSYQAMNYYYRVPITGSEALALLERNHYYKINVHIGVLGSLNPNEAVELKAKFEIMDWFEAGIDADINQYQYLVLDEYSSVMNNVDEIRMPYISSSQLKMDNQGDTEYTRITKVTYPNYNAETSDDSHTSTTTLTGSAISDAGFSIDEENGELIFNHPISSEDYVPYTITVEVWNMQGMHVEWEITQYPPIYIEGEYNAEGMHVETDWWGNKTYSKGNRFVYGVWEGSVTDDAGNSFGNANNYDNASNKNPNQYTIRITSFDIEGSEYAIGDPRSSTVDNLRYLQNKTGRDAQTGEQRKLQYYYPTRKDDVEQVIAPAFKIASSWGVVTTNDAYDFWGSHFDEVLTYETAQRRCASYQENGYPAGRWRIPTEAEIEYIISLSDRGMIPPLFNGSYYASSGRYYNNEANPPGFATAEAGKGYSVRCVYDVWYWGNDKIDEPNEFTWGDEPMQ